MPRRRGKNWTASGYDRTRKAKRHLGTFATRAEAARKEAEWKLRARPTAAETCERFVERWLVEYPRPREATRRTHREHTRRFAKDFKGVKLADIDRPTARTWALKHRSDHAAVRAMFGDAVRDGLVDFNPFAGLRLPQSRGRRDIIALTERELRALGDLALDERMDLGEYAPQYRAMVLFAGYVGLRPGELFALRRDDIRGEHLLVERAYSSHSHETTLPKNGKSRTVVVPPPALEAIQTDVPVHPSGLLFETPAGKQWTASLHHRYWLRIRLLANRPGFDFYELRHAAATMLLERGVTPWDVAIQLGHTDGGILVMRLYGHPAEAGARARLLAAWDVDVAPLTEARSGAIREQVS